MHSTFKINNEIVGIDPSLIILLAEHEGGTTSCLQYEPIPFLFRKYGMIRSTNKDSLANHSTKGIPNVDLLASVAKVTSGARSLTIYVGYEKRPLYNKFRYCNVRFDVYGNGLATKRIWNI